MARPSRLTLLLGAALFFLLALPVGLRQWVRDGFFEFQAPAWYGLAAARDIGTYWGLRAQGDDGLIEAGRDLARLNAAYEVRLQRMDAVEDELHRLEELLGLPSHPEHRYEVARVARREVQTWWQALIIRKGARHGVQKGDAVVSASGVVGRISEVHLYTAEVELISSPTFRVAAHVEGDLRPVVFQGYLTAPFEVPRGKVANVPHDLRTPGQRQRLVTSSLGGVFPDGLTLGFIEGLAPAPDGMFQSGNVRLDGRLLTLREVAVLIPLEREVTGP